jgi:hypothetical protein
MKYCHHAGFCLKPGKGKLGQRAPATRKKQVVKFNRMVHE